MLEPLKFDWKKTLFANDTQVLASLLQNPSVNRFVITGDSQWELCRSSAFKWRMDDHIQA